MANTATLREPRHVDMEQQKIELSVLCSPLQTGLRSVLDSSRSQVHVCMSVCLLCSLPALPVSHPV